MEQKSCYARSKPLEFCHEINSFDTLAQHVISFAHPKTSVASAANRGAVLRVSSGVSAMSSANQ
jgi:hypothetical protein